MASNSVEMSRTQRLQEACWWLTAETDVSYIAAGTVYVKWYLVKSVGGDQVGKRGGCLVGQG